MVVAIVSPTATCRAQRWTSARGSPIALARCRLVPAHISSCLHTSTRARTHQPVAAQILPGPEVDGVRRAYRLMRPAILSGSKRGTPRFDAVDAASASRSPGSSGATRIERRKDCPARCTAGSKAPMPSLRRGSPIHDDRHGAARQPERERHQPDQQPDIAAAQRAARPGLRA